MIDASMILQIVSAVGIAYIVKVAILVERRFTNLERDVKSIAVNCPYCPNPVEARKK